jgi:succinoglycan biosynthesis protein ExoA
LDGISILIPCLNEEKFIVQLLTNIIEQRNLPENWEALILDGLSTDKTREIIAAYSSKSANIRLLDNPKKYQAAGMNIGIKKAKYDIILRMDVHTEYSLNYISQCMNELEVQKADNVGGAARTKWKGTFQHANSLAYHSPFSVGGAAFHDSAHAGEVDTVPYGCWRKSTLEEIGAYDEEFIRNEDDELNLRLQKAGKKIWLSQTIHSWYYPRNTLSTLWKQYYQYGFWKVAVLKKHRIPASPRHLVPSAFVLYLSSFLAVPFLSWYSYIWTTVLAIYLVINIFFTIKSMKHSHSLGAVCWLPIIFLSYHLSYGLGFWAGIGHFMLSRKDGFQAGSSATKLTR